jgi:membrane fusion protein, multidrug efflux system
MKTADLPPPPRISESQAPVKSSSPSAPKPAGGRWWITLIVVLAVVGLGVFIYFRIFTGKPADASKSRTPHDLPVVIAKAYRGDLDQYLVGLGTVTPEATVTLKSRVDGAITELHFDEGQMVKAGDFLLQIDPGPYDAALKQAQGQKAKDVAAKDNADWVVKADQEAIKEKGIAESQLHTDLASQASFAGAIDVDDANIKTAQLNVDYAHITSPITGRIGLRLVDLGNIVHAADTTGLAVITQLQPITVVFTLPEDNIQQIQERMAHGQPLAVDAYDRDLSKKLASGKVLALDSQIDPTTGTLKIKAEFDNKNFELFPSQFVNARMLVNTIKGAVLVPTAAIQHSPSSTFVYVMKPDPDAAKESGPATKPTTQAGKGTGGLKGAVSIREVTVGPSQAAVRNDGEDTTVVLSGLEPGEIVVTDGVDKLLDGMKVIGRQAANTPRKATTRMSTTSESSATSQPTHRRRKPAAVENNE